MCRKSCGLHACTMMREETTSKIDGIVKGKGKVIPLQARCDPKGG